LQRIRRWKGIMRTSLGLLKRGVASLVEGCCRVFELKWLPGREKLNIQ